MASACHLGITKYCVFANFLVVLYVITGVLQKNSVLVFLFSYCSRCINYCRIFTELAESLLDVIVDTPGQVRYSSDVIIFGGDKSLNQVLPSLGVATKCLF